MHKISSTKLREIISQNPSIHLIDVRTPIEFAFGHVPESINFPYEELHQFNFPKADEYYFICHSGSRAQQACEELSKLGYKHLIHVKDGFENWNGEVESGF